MRDYYRDRDRMKGDSCPLMMGQEDFGPAPYALDMTQAVCENQNFRTALWTGEHLQVTLMCIPPGGEIGLEVHPDTDQMLRVETGRGLVRMGSCRDRVQYQEWVGAGEAIFVPAGTWHNLLNRGCCPMKLYSVYAPPHHPHGTVHRTKAEAEQAEQAEQH